LCAIECTRVAEQSRDRGDPRGQNSYRAEQNRRVRRQSVGSQMWTWRDGGIRAEDDWRSSTAPAAPQVTSRMSWSSDVKPSPQENPADGRVVLQTRFAVEPAHPDVDRSTTAVGEGGGFGLLLAGKLGAVGRNARWRCSIRAPGIC
jgi:hypothetical protein